MWPLGVVVFQVAIQVCLHLFYRLIPGRSPLDTEVFIQQCAMQSLDKTVALRPAYLGCPVFNSLQLQKQLVGMMVWAPTVENLGKIWDTHLFDSDVALYLA